MARLSDLTLRLKGGFFYVLLLAGAFVGGWFWPPFLVLFFLTAGFIMGRELGRAILPEGFRSLIVPFGLLALLPALTVRLPVADFFAGSLIFTGLAALSLFIYVLLTLMSALVKIGPSSLTSGTLLGAASIYLWFTLALAVTILLDVPHGFQWLAFAVLVPALTDVFAYFGGVLFGRRKIVPKLSPKKTVAGFLSGIIGAFIVTLFFFLVRPGMHQDTPVSTKIIVSFALLSAVVLSMMSQLGDWLASAIKRETGIKDFGMLFAGHGGLMDRLDSFLFNLPFVYIVALVVERFVFGGK